MTAKEFNEKYKDYLEERHYGAEGFDVPEFLDWLDVKFQDFIKYPNFSYSQIKSKFNWGCFYCEGLPKERVEEVEDKITEILKYGK